MNSVFAQVIAFIGIVSFVIAGILLIIARRRADNLLVELLETQKEFDNYKENTEHLKQYQTIVDAEVEAKRVEREAQRIRNAAQIDYDAKIAEANELAGTTMKEARTKAKELRERAEQQLADAHELANKIETDAKARAEEIAGNAWDAKENAEQYEKTVKAMKNIIKGYGDEYLVPNRGVLDELAEEYDHKEAGQELAKVRTLIKSMIKNGEAADCDYVEDHRRSTAIEFVLDAFNGKIDTIMSKVKHDNYGKLMQQLEDALRVVNHNGGAFRNARVVKRYYDVVVEQLKWAVAVQELRRLDLEEQRRIKEQMREEERARREFEKALKEAEKEEKLLKKAMEEAEKRLAEAAEEERAKYEKQLGDLKKKLEEAEAKEERAKSMAQQTKQGHVYVISNVGSFGDEVFKIGLTRRLEPKDRVRELGDASVPFEFDIHAMIHSDDAPALEYKLHQVFESHHVNKVNSRKEFFRVPISEIKSTVDKLGHETHWTMKAEAIQYRESLQIESQRKQQTAVGEQN